VLVELTARVRGALEPGDLLGRWGGEEFVVLFDGDDVERRAERLRAAVAERPIAAGTVEIAQTVSVGAVAASPELRSLDALVEAADRCLYAAKRGGRNRVALRPDAVVASTVGGIEPEGIGMARALAYAAGLRDEEPEAHAAEVSLLATLVAERLDLTEAGVWRCRLGGWLHDVGKVAIPDSILDKPGPLDDAEWELMRTHPALGADIVLRFSQLREAAAAVRHHHERYDGGGYPDGLAGTAIPVEARIVAAADAYSAMTAARPYSPARAPADAAEELRASAGSQFDPEVVEALIDVLGPLARPVNRPRVREEPAA
jgi:HD-GYP domain-containing protein (c-di-GMP phosphodiesterase class II)